MWPPQASRYATRYGEMCEAAAHVFADADEEYASIAAVKKRLEEWKARWGWLGGGLWVCGGWQRCVAWSAEAIAAVGGGSTAGSMLLTCAVVLSKAHTNTHNNNSASHTLSYA